MDFLERIADTINTWLLGHVDEDGNPIYEVIHSPALVEDNSMALMVMPSNNYEHYFDGSFRQQFSFQVIARHANQLKSYMTLVALSTYLDNLENHAIISLDDSFEFEGITILTDTNGVGIDEKGYIYAVQLGASLFVSAK